MTIIFSAFQDIDTLTFSQLMEKLMEGLTARTGRLPSTKALRESEAEVLIEAKTESAHLTIYANGLLIYGREESDGFHETVCPMDSLRRMAKDPEDASLGYIGEESYSDAPWHFPIEYICGQRLDHNQEERERDHEALSIEWDGNEWTRELTQEGFIEAAERMEQEKKAADEHRARIRKMREAMALLTAKQREVVEMLYLHDKKQREAAEELGISDRAVRYHLEAAVKKIKRHFAS